MDYSNVNYPDIILGNKNGNPIIRSPNSDFTIEFAMTRETSYDLEEYKQFLDSAIRMFRHSNTYTNYKSYLYSIGMTCCQFHPYIQETDMLEMHHCMLTIYDIAVMITEHIINTYGSITEFDLAELLKFEHIHNRIPIVMLCKTCHQQYHHQYLYVHPNMCFGKWWELIEKYKTGLNRDIMYKLMMYLKCSFEDKLPIQRDKNMKLLQLRQELINWSRLSEEVKVTNGKNTKDL